MSSTAFQRTPLAVAVCAALLQVSAHATPEPVENPSPDGTVTLYTAATDLRLQNFDVTALPDGRFAVAWLEQNLDDVNESIKLARFDSTGTQVGDTVAVYDDNSASISLSNPVMAADGDGDLVVAWQADASGGGDGCSDTVAFAQVSNDDAVGAMQWAPDSSGQHCNAALAMDQDGVFVLGWTLEDPENASQRFQYQTRRFNADGTPLGASTTFAQAGNTLYPMALAMQGDTWLAAWSANGDADTGYALLVYGQRFNINGNPVDAEPFRLDNGSQDGASLSQIFPALEADEDGGFVGVWHQQEAVDSQPVTSLQGQRLQADGTPGAGFLVAANTAITDFSKFAAPGLGTDGNGDLIATWSHFQNGQPPGSLAAGVDGATSVGDPVEFGSGDENTVDYSTASRVAINDSVAALVWFQQQDGAPYVIKARVQALPDNPGQDPTPTDNGGDDGGGGGGGGATGLLTLLGLGVLALRRRR